MSTFLPKDSNDNPISALRLKASGAHSLNATGASARNSTAFDAATRIVSVYAEQPIYMAFGGASVSASVSGHYFPAGVYYDFAIGGDNTAHYTHIAVLAAGSDGAVYISEKE